jgi:hypothetical protein
MTAIDLCEQLDDIRSRYPEYWRSDEALRVAFLKIASP